MKKIHSLLLIPSSLLLISYSYAQPFQRIYGAQWSETGTCIQYTQDSNYIISGIASSFTNGMNDMYLLKVSPQGNLLWAKAYGTNWIEYCYYVSTCTDGGFILTGSIDSTTWGDSDLLLVRTDSAGTVQWAIAVGGPDAEFGWYVLQTNDGGFLATGSATSFSNGSWDGYLVRTDASGNVLWTKVFASPRPESLYGISKTSDGGFIVTGSVPDTSLSSDLWLVKLDANGDTLWTKRYGRQTEDAGYSVVQTSDGGYLVAGDMHTNMSIGAHNMIALRTDSLGNYLWHYLYGSNPGSEIAYQVLPDSANGFYLLGNTNAFGGGQKDFFFIHADSAGTMKWKRTIGTTYDDDAWYFQPSLSGNGFILVGTSNSFGGGYGDVYLVETDSLGNSSCFDSTAAPDFNIPSLQVNSGSMQIISGGTVKPVSLTTTVANTLVQNPCLLIAVFENTNDENDISIFPNPTSGVFQIQLATGNWQLASSQKQVASIEIYNVYGEKLYSTIINNQLTLINLNAPSGIYFYKVTADDSGTGKIIATGKLIIE